MTGQRKRRFAPLVARSVALVVILVVIMAMVIAVVIMIVAVTVLPTAVMVAEIDDDCRFTVAVAVSPMATDLATIVSVTNRLRVKPTRLIPCEASDA